MKQQILDILHYLYNPYPVEADAEMQKGLLKKVFNIYLICLLGFLCASVVIVVVSFLSNKIFDFNLLRTINENKFRVKLAPSESFLLIVFLGPILEELLFRLILKPTRLNVAIPVTLFFYNNILPDFATLFNWSLLLSNTIEILTAILVLFTLYFLITDKFLDILKGKYFRVLLYSSILSFAFIHIFNFSNLTVGLIFLSPIIVLPQLIYGIILSYVRINFRHGFFFGLLIHIMINLPGRFF